VRCSSTTQHRQTGESILRQPVDIGGRGDIYLDRKHILGPFPQASNSPDDLQTSIVAVPYKGTLA
jgi:hypothetical protein